MPQLFLCTLLHTMNTLMANEVQLATTQDLMGVSGHTYSCLLTCVVNVSLPLHFGVFIIHEIIVLKIICM